MYLEWWGDQLRTIVSTEGSTGTISYAFDDVVPNAQPEVYDLPGEGNWGQGHMGRGVFLLRSGANNDGVVYSDTTAQVHLFPAADGDGFADGLIGRSSRPDLALPADAS